MSNLRPIVSGKKGMSAVISNLIIILLVIVAVGIIWTVVQGLIEDTTDQISTDQLTGIDAKIESVNVNGDTVEVGVRNTGENGIIGVELIIDNGRESMSTKVERSLSPKTTKVFSTNYMDGGIGLVKIVSVAPLFENDEGEVESTSDTLSSKKLDNEEVFENIEATSWWRMNGDARDTFGSNNGNIEGADCEAEGEYGQACEFGASDLINVSSLDSLPTAYAYWAKNGTGWDFYYQETSEDLCYKNSQEISCTDLTQNWVDVSGSDVVFGQDDVTMDEVIFFDEELDENTVRALYYLDLTTA